MDNVLVAMSGGVDSSVAAYLLKKQGFGVSGATLRLYSPSSADNSAIPCCTSRDIEDAKAVCTTIGADFYVIDFQKEFESYVIKPFVDSYLNGETPNPCVECNRYLKFPKVFDKANELGHKFVATGHYCGIERHNGRYLLKKSKNTAKDQSYVLYSLHQDMLSRLLFPLGGLSKDEVRLLAAETGFSNSNKPDSQDICFIKDGDYVGFINRYTNKIYKSGQFLDMSGNVIGTHSGMIAYTVGQRRGLGTGFGARTYVISKNAKNNTVTLGKDEDLFSKSLNATDINYIPFDTLDSPIKLKAKVRYRMEEKDCTIFPTGTNSALVEFDKPQRAFSPGQSVVFYDGEYVVGGGKIV